MHEEFVEQQRALDTSPFAKSQISLQSAQKQTSDVRRIENVNLASEHERFEQRLQVLLRNANVQLTTTMANAAMAHVKEPPTIDQFGI